VVSKEKSAFTRPVTGVALAVALWLLGVGVIVLGARGWLPPLASQHGAGIDRMLTYLLVCTGALVLIGHLVLGYFVLRSASQDRASTEVPSQRVQRVWSIAPAIVMTLVAEGGVLVVGLPVWAQLYGQGPPADAVLVEVTGEQFTWNVRYPGKDGELGRTDPTLIGTDNGIGLDRDDSAAADDIVDLAVMYLPVNRPVHIRLRSKDVLHSFYLPMHRIKQDAVPGMTIDVWFVPDREGEYEIACAELCGFGHYQMRGTLYVVSDEEFARWTNERSAGP
jgi:cytochrome c oxidase subunit 2